MDPHDRFTQLYRKYSENLHPKEYYMKRILDGLYERAIVSNTPSPTLLPAWDDAEDIQNIIAAMENLILDFKQSIS